MDLSPNKCDVCGKNFESCGLGACFDCDQWIGICRSCRDKSPYKCRKCQGFKEEINEMVKKIEDIQNKISKKSRTSKKVDKNRITKIGQKNTIQSD